MRVRLALIRCLRQAQFIATATGEASASSTTTTTTAGDGGRGGRGKGVESTASKKAGSEGAKSSTATNSEDGLKNYSERLEDYIKSLELLGQHVGTRMLRQQRSRTLVSTCTCVVHAHIHVCVHVNITTHRYTHTHILNIDQKLLVVEINV